MNKRNKKNRKEDRFCSLTINDRMPQYSLNFILNELKQEIKSIAINNNVCLN